MEKKKERRRRTEIKRRKTVLLLLLLPYISRDRETGNESISINITLGVVRVSKNAAVR